MGFGAGERNRLITVERAQVVDDDHGGEVETWSILCRAWASVRYGTGEERRTAAREETSQVATFSVLASSQTRGATARDRIVFDGGVWDIRGLVPSIDDAEMIFTAVRA